MEGIRITFRLKPYQLARALQIVRRQEPNYKLISINNLVKTIYHDYIAKMTVNRLDTVPQHFINEITALTKAPNNKITLAELINIKKHPERSPKELSSEESSEKSVVTDFSPPESWMD